jgi:hypothetical protein
MRKFRSSQDSSSISREATGAVPVQFESIIPNPKAKLPDQLREVMRLKHYSIRTERSYIDWVRRYVIDQAADMSPVRKPFYPMSMGSDRPHIDTTPRGRSF